MPLFNNRKGNAGTGKGILTKIGHKLNPTGAAYEAGRYTAKNAKSGMPSYEADRSRRGLLGTKSFNDGTPMPAIKGGLSAAPGTKSYPVKTELSSAPGSTFKPDASPIQRFNTHYAAASRALGVKPDSNMLLKGHDAGNHGHVAGNMSDLASQLRDRLSNDKNSYGHTVGRPLAHDKLGEIHAHNAILGMEEAAQDYHRIHRGQGKGWD